MATKMLTDVETISLDHIVRVNTYGAHCSFTTPPMLASVASTWARMEICEHGVGNVEITCDEYCWCKH